MSSPTESAPRLARGERKARRAVARIEIPDYGILLLIGVSGSGKTTFARKHFLETEIVSSDRCRALVSDDEKDGSATPEAFELLHKIVDLRLRRRGFVVVDATNLRVQEREPFFEIAKRNFAPVSFIALDPGPGVCLERSRPRGVSADTIRRHIELYNAGMRRVRSQGFSRTYFLEGTSAIDAADVSRGPVWNDRRTDTRKFDIVGDVHGCHRELLTLLDSLGYVRTTRDDGSVHHAHPEGRIAVFVGDLMDRGPENVAVLRTVKTMVEDGAAMAVPGNHDVKLLRWLSGETVDASHGLDLTIAEFDRETPEFRAEAAAFIRGLVAHLWLDGGALAIAHAGLREDMIGRAHADVREHAIFGDRSLGRDEEGLTIRKDWARDYRGSTAVVYGHTPVARAQWVNNTICLDTGCVFGGSLTALRWPERELVSVPAERPYAELIRPLIGDASTAQAAADDMIGLEDVQGRRVIGSMRYGRRVAISEEQASAALEVMSREAVDPRWLIHLPPTMSPVETSELDGYLEHPAEAFAYYRRAGVLKVVVQTKHMGSRACMLVTRNDAVAVDRFGLPSPAAGEAWTRTGRTFFKRQQRDEILRRARAAAETAGIFDELDADWMLLDAEVMPWNMKAQGLIENQYAPTGAAARALNELLADAYGRLRDRGIEGDPDRVSERRVSNATAFGEAWRRYCWAPEELAIAPFHLLAAGSAVHDDKDHLWHTAAGRRMGEADGLFRETGTTVVDLTDPEAMRAATEAWIVATEAGAEGIVVKPLQFLAHGARGRLELPALKVRGRSYLRIIYGPDYDAPESLALLRRRGLKTKRKLALDEFVLGLEGLQRFVAGAPLRDTHVCAFGVLASESEPVDPRL